MAKDELDDLIDEIEEEKKNNAEVLNEKDIYLAQLKKNQPDVYKILETRIKQRELSKKEAKEKAKTLAEVTKELLESEFVKLDDGVDLTINDLLVAKATATLMSSDKTTFKDLNEAQKVIKNDTDDNRGGFTLILNTNGQDLGA